MLCDGVFLKKKKQVRLIKVVIHESRVGIVDSTRIKQVSDRDTNTKIRHYLPRKASAMISQHQRPKPKTEFIGLGVAFTEVHCFELIHSNPSRSGLSLLLSRSVCC